MKHLLYSVLVIFALLLSGCANAGKDQTVNANTLVTLDGSASTSSVEGNITAYHWRQIRGKKVKLSSKKAVSPTFTAPNVSKKTKLVFRLTTKETGGLRSPFRSRDYVTVTVIPVDNTADTTPPVITLNGGDVTLTVGETYTEQGATATDDRDGNVEVSITGNVDTATAGTYTVTYTATDTAGNSATESRTVTINDDANNSASIYGTITDIAGNALKNVKVYSASHTTYTDANGHYILENNGTSPVSIVAELTNYIQNSQVVDMDINVTQNFTMVYVDKIEKFDSEVGMEVKTKGAKINFPASSVAHEDGTAYTGEVTTKVAYNRVTSVTGKAAFPGDYIGETTEGNTTILRSYGFIDVTMEDNASNPLKVANGSSVTLTFPMDENIEETPATIPLWYYDTQKGIWVEDGIATYNATTNSYSGEVTHFTTWNLDAKMNQGSLEGCIEDSEGNPVTNALLNIEGVGWASGLKQNSESTFTFLRAPTGIPVSLTAFSTQGASQTKTITLNPNENRVMTDCLIIETNATNKLSTLKGRLVNSNGDLITDNASISLYNGSNYITTNTTSSGIFNIPFPKPDEGKLRVIIRVNGLTMEQSYVIADNQNMLDIGDLIVDLIKITGKLIDSNGNSVSPVDYGYIYVGSAYSGSKIYQDTFTSLNFLRPTSHTVRLKFNIDGYFFEQNATLTSGSLVNIGNIIIPGIRLTGKLLDKDGNPIIVQQGEGHIFLYDPQNPDVRIGYGVFGANGIITTKYFTPPQNNKVLLKIMIGQTTIEKLITIDGNHSIIELGDIQTSLTKLVGHIVDENNNSISTYMVDILKDDANQTYLGYSSRNDDGNIHSNYFLLPDDGNIIVRFRKSYANQVYTQRSYHFNVNEKTDIGTVSLEVVNLKGVLRYIDGAPMPEGLKIYTYNSNYEVNATIHTAGGHFSTLANGLIDTSAPYNRNGFFRPNDNKIKVLIILDGEDYITTIDLNQTDKVTQKDILVDAVTIVGSIKLPHEINATTLPESMNIYIPSIHSSGWYGTSTDSTGKFSMRPFLRPTSNTVNLMIDNHHIHGEPIGNIISLNANMHETDVGINPLKTTLVKSCVQSPPEGFTGLSIRYGTAFNATDIDGYNNPISDINRTSGTFKALIWQSDNNVSFYAFTGDKTGNITLVSPHQASLDLTNHCIPLHTMTVSPQEVTITTSNTEPDSTMYVMYQPRHHPYSYNGSPIPLTTNGNTMTFNALENGVYLIKQRHPSSQVGGIIQISINGITKEVTLPIQKERSYQNDWIFFSISIYEGNITIETINKEDYGDVG